MLEDAGGIRLKKLIQGYLYYKFIRSAKSIACSAIDDDKQKRNVFNYDGPYWSQKKSEKIIRWKPK